MPTRTDRAHLVDGYPQSEHVRRQIETQEHGGHDQQHFRDFDLRRVLRVVLLLLRRAGRRRRRLPPLSRRVKRHRAPDPGQPAHRPADHAVEHDDQAERYDHVHQNVRKVQPHVNVVPRLVHVAHLLRPVAARAKTGLMYVVYIVSRDGRRNIRIKKKR